MYTPLSGSDILSIADEHYNTAHKKTRTIIEHVNGILKMRFRSCLKHRTLHYHPEIASQIINTCCVLHNLCIENGIRTPAIESINDDPLDGMYVNSDERGSVDVILGRVNPLLAEARISLRRLIHNHFS